jgi:hypothetical protein
VGIEPMTSTVVVHRLYHCTTEAAPSLHREMVISQRKMMDELHQANAENQGLKRRLSERLINWKGLNGNLPKFTGKNEENIRVFIDRMNTYFSINPSVNWTYEQRKQAYLKGFQDNAQEILMRNSWIKLPCADLL